MTSTNEVQVRGARLAWDRSGPETAAPLVWGHGLTSSRADEDRFPLVDMARVRLGYDVVRYDAHGHGQSSALSAPERGSWAELALDQIALTEHLGLGQVVLGGASMGAATAMHAVLALGERVAGLLLVIPPTGWAERAAQVDVYEQMASIVDQRGVDALIAASAANPAPDPFISNAQYRDHRAASLRAAQPARLAANLRGAAHADLPPVVDLAGISAPTLVLAWTGDAAHPVSTAELLQATLPNCTTVVASTAEDVETWTDRAIGFLNGL